MNHRNSPRLLAAGLLRELVVDGRSLSDLLPPALATLDDPRDRGLVQELCFGVARRYRRLDALAGLLLERPLRRRDADVQMVLLVGLYQLLELRVAEHAAVAETVTAAKRLGKPWAGGLVNALLRRFLRERAALEAKLGRIGIAPDWLVARLRAAWPEHWHAIVAALGERPPLVVRVNRRRLSRDGCRDALRAAGIDAAPVAAAPDALVLAHAVDVAALPGFAEGALSVQDAGAQLAAPLLDLRPGQRILDACAAPGGKTGHLLELAPAGAELTAVDRDSRRLARVDENLARLGLAAEVCEGDLERPRGAWAERRYQRVLLDVPCSATGVIRRHPDIALLRRERDIAPLAARQAAILDRAWRLVEPGGRLVYATCSLLADENEAQIDAFLARTPDARERPLDVDWGHRRAHGRQTLPGEATMDGFYYALLERE